MGLLSLEEMSVVGGSVYGPFRVNFVEVVKSVFISFLYTSDHRELGNIAHFGLWIKS